LFIFLFKAIEYLYFFQVHFKSFCEAFLAIFKGFLKENEILSNSQIQKLLFHSLGGIK
jgi:hypothetical protein